MADDRVVFVLHRAIVVRDSGRATKGAVYRHKDSPAEFAVRPADEREIRESEQKLRDDVDRRVTELMQEAAVRRRVEELRREGYRGEG